MRKRNNTVSSVFDKLADQYDAWFDEQGKIVFDIEVCALRSVLAYLPKPWLEIGVGSGRFAQVLEIETGVDPSIKLVEMARHRGITAFLGRGEQELFDKESFGTVFLIVTLCFLGSPLEVLREANRILIPDGKIVLGLVLSESPWGKLYQQEKEEGHDFYRYATFYRCNEVVKLLVQAGFMTEKIVSTLFQKPGEVHNMEQPKEGFSPCAGFTVMMGAK